MAASARDDVETLAGLAAQTGVAVENVRLHLVVKKQAVTDELTGLANRRQFYEVLGREFERSQRFSTPLSLIMFDIDDFKRVNDTHPMKHLAGDAALRSVADEISGLTRDIDLDARHGGEEFAILLPQTDLAGGVQPRRAPERGDREPPDPVRRPADLGHRQLRGGVHARGHHDPDRSDRRGREPHVQQQAEREESGNPIS